MPKPASIEFPGVEPIPILYEDRSVLAIDKPRGWMLVPFSWQTQLAGGNCLFDCSGRFLGATARLEILAIRSPT